MSLHPHRRAATQGTQQRIEVVDPFEHPAADTPERLYETLFATRAGITDVDTQLVSLLARRVELARMLRAATPESSVEADGALPTAAAAEAARQGLPERDVRALFSRITKMSHGLTDEPA